MNILIKNGRLLNPATHFDGIIDVLIKDEKISKIGVDMKEPADLIIEAANQFVMPGFVDLHVHFRDFEQTYKEDIISGSYAAAHGGVTTVCAMPNTKPPLDNIASLQYVLAKARNTAITSVLPVSAITKGQLGQELVAMDDMLHHGACSFSEDGLTVMDTALYRKAMKKAAEMDALVMAHCHNIDLSLNTGINEGEVSKHYQEDGMPSVAEDIIVARDIFLAKENGTRLHICHLTTEGSVALVKMAKELGLNVTAEACPHHFILSENDIDELKGNFKISPPLRTPKDVEAIRQGLKDGTIDAIATDHAPHSKEDKQVKFKDAPVGIVGVETGAALTYTTLVLPGIISPLEMAEKMSYNPAKILGRQAEIGDISPGKFADIVIFDPAIEYSLDSRTFFSKSRNTPFDGKKVTGQVDKTIFRGKIVYDRAGK